MRLRCLFVVATVALVPGGASADSGAARSRPQHASRLLVFVAPFRPTGPQPHGLELLDRAGHVLRVISTARFGTIGAWSPDGSQIAWKDPDGIHVENANGSVARLVVPTQTSCRSCQGLSFLWSPDGRSLAIGSAGAHGDRLELVPLDGGATRVLAGSTRRGVFFTPAFWTSDGRSLVYDETGTTLAFPGAAIQMLTPATGRTRTLWHTAVSQGSHPPLISRNGRYRAYVTEVDRYHRRLTIVDTATGAGHVVPTVNPTNLVGWAPDSSTLAVVESSRHVVVVSARGTVLRSVGPGEDFIWGRRGELFVLRADGNQVWVSDDRRPEQPLFRVPENGFVVSLDAS